MFIVFGTDKVFAPVESLITAPCALCEQDVSWTLWREQAWASFCFIRVFPMSTRFHLGCDSCGYGLPLDKPLALAMLDKENRTQALHDSIVRIISNHQFHYRSQSSVPKK